MSIQSRTSLLALTAGLLRIGPTSIPIGATHRQPRKRRVMAIHRRDDGRWGKQYVLKGVRS